MPYCKASCFLNKAIRILSTKLKKKHAGCLRRYCSAEKNLEKSMFKHCLTKGQKLIKCCKQLGAIILKNIIFILVDQLIVGIAQPV
jgi:hypothetical protein